MLQLLLVAAIIIVVAANDIRSESLPFCGYTSMISTCPGDVSQANITYPFWIEKRTVDDAGRDCMNYPGFQIKCAPNGGGPVINISSNLYHVLGVYSKGGGGYLTVKDVALNAQKCPRPQRNFSIESEPFLSKPDYTTMMTFFYNCSRFPPDVEQHIPCLDNYYNNSTGRSFAFPTELEISRSQFDWYENCEEAVVVAVDNGFGSGYYTNIVKDEFYLFYQVPVNCGNCDLSRGKCWVNETNLHVTTSFHCDCKGYTLENGICRSRYSNSYYENNDAYYGNNKGMQRAGLLEYVAEDAAAEQLG